MRAVQSTVLLAVSAQTLLLAALAATVGLTPAGWSVGLACGTGTAALLVRSLRRSGMAALGPANRVTLVRALLVAGVAALVTDTFLGATPGGTLTGAAAVALALDAVDGHVARRTGSVSAVGARFDMEVDAFLILVLSIYAVRPCGIWVLVIGGARYGYALAAIAVPWLGGAVPARTWRKAVAVAQGVALTVATAQVLPAAAAESVLVVAALLLAWSFGSQGWWLARRRHVAVPVEQALEPAGH